MKTAEVSAIPADATVELHDFWTRHPDLRQACIDKYGHDPVNQPLPYWRHGLAEPEHADVLASVEQAGGVFSLGDVKRWEREEVAEAKLEKAGIPASAHYRPANVVDQNCGTCNFYKAGRCTMFDAPVQTDMVCDKWAAKVDKAVEPVYETSGAPKSSHAVANWSPEDIAEMGRWADALEPNPLAKTATPTKAAGIAVRAANTGRVLMIQRSNADSKDKAAGKWEFPGGKLDDGEHPYDGARREWQEEMGLQLPKGQHVSQWRNGVYHGFVHEVPTESSVRINLDSEDRHVLNPDDPDGDDIEVAAWWDPEDMKRSPAIRDELRASRPWSKVTKAQGRLYLISHAKTRYNQPGQPHGDRVQGWKNVSLDKIGHQQAEALGRHFKDIGLDELHSSDLTRAKQTAQIIGRIAGVKDQPSRNQRPWNLGSFAGHSSADVIPKLKPYLTSKSGQPVDGGESFDDFRDRFLPALEALLKKVDAGKTVGLVTHSRNVELAQGWLGGKGHRTKVDTKAISSDDIDPATVIEISPGSGGKLQMGKPSVITKAEAHPTTLHLRVHGVSKAPGGLRAYRMATRDGHYVGRTLPTRVRARKGDVLKIQAGDFLQDVQGDMRWINPNVVSHYTDAPHSWRELSALAGGELAKDEAPGPAGDLPPAGDLGASSSMPSQQTLSSVGPDPVGPTLSQVHVNVPLPNISVSYVGERRRRRKEDADDVLRGEFLPVAKSDQWKQLACGVVLEPNTLDSQDDYMLPHHVEKAAHAFMKRIIRGTASVSKLQHRTQGFKRNGKGVIPVESFIAPTDFSYDGQEMIKAGSWVMVMHVEDPDLWQDFLDGKYTGFSVGGTGIRRSLQGADYGPEVPRGYMPQQPADFHPQIPPDVLGAVLV